MQNVQIDFSRVTGKMKPMHAVNNSPVSNNMDAFRDAGIPFCRNSDAALSNKYGGAHAHDVLNIFPDFDADENDPANYDFALTDKTVRETYECGCEFFYRLGARIEHEIRKYHTVPPRDFHKYARICEHIIRHYCYGWADGMELPIKYWEIWNEADNRDYGPVNSCWNGTIEQFHEFFEVLAKHLKGCFPEIKIGGPAYTGFWDRCSYIEAFLDYAQAHDVPLDFFSWHGYRDDPHDYPRYTAYVKEQLDKHGYGNAELILDEWNYVRAWQGEGLRYSHQTIANEKGMAFNAAAMLTAQKTEMDMFMYYDARPSTPWNGLFKPYTEELQKPYYALWQFNKLYRLENEVFSETDSEEIYAGAAAKDGKAAAQLAYYSDLELENKTVTVSLKGLKNRSRIVGLVTDKDRDNEKFLEIIVPAGETQLILDLKLHTSLLLLLEEV